MRSCAALGPLPFPDPATVKACFRRTRVSWHGMAVAVGVRVAVEVAVAVGVLVLVAVGVGVKVARRPLGAVAVPVRVAVGVAVGVDVAVAVGVVVGRRIDGPVTVLEARKSTMRASIRSANSHPPSEKVSRKPER